MLTALKPIVLAVLAAMILPSVPAAAQEGWPSKPMRVVIPFAPGGSADTIGRLIADHLTKTFGQQTIAENRAGAGGVTGSAAVARARPDGTTFVVSGVASHVIAPAINDSVAFDPLKDFTHLAVIGGPPSVLLVHPSLGIGSAGELERYVASVGRKIPYASPGVGTHAHLVAEAYQRAARLSLEHVPYRGGADTISDLLSGRVTIGSIALSTANPHIKAGSLRALALTAPRRLPELPDVPTFAELGHAELTAPNWFGLAAPAGLSPEIAERLNAEVSNLFNQPEIRARLSDEAMSMELPPLPEVLPFIAREKERWGAIAKTAAPAAR